MTQEQFERLAVQFDIMSNGCVSYHDFLRQFLLNLKPTETKMMFRRRKLPLPTQVSGKGKISVSLIVTLNSHIQSVSAAVFNE